LFGQDLVMLVSEQWLDGDPAPIVTVTPQPFSDGAIHGLRWGSAEEAKKLDFHAPWAGFYALEVDPDSPAAASGVKPGDHLTFEDDMNAFQQRYAFEAGSKFSYTVMRKGGSMRTLDLPRGRYDEEAWKPKK
jgi:hypothetical protein